MGNRFFFIGVCFYYFILGVLPEVQAQETYYGCYQNKTLTGYLKVQITPQYYRTHECFEVRRQLYNRGIREDQEVQTQSFLNKRGELLAVSQQIRSKEKNAAVFVEMEKNQIRVTSLENGLPHKSWNIPWQKKLYLSCQTFLWCNPSLLKANTSFQIQTLKLPEFGNPPKVVTVSLHLKAWNTYQGVKAISFRSQEEKQQAWLEGKFDREGNILESRLYLNQEKPFFSLARAKPSLLEKFGPYGIRISLDHSIYGELDELELEGMNISCLSSPYLNVRYLANRKQILTIKRVEIPYQEDSLSKAAFFDERKFQQLRERVIEATNLVKAVGEPEILARCRLFLRLLQKAGMVARIKYGFFLARDEFVFSSWLEIDRGKGWEPYHLTENRFGFSANYFYPGLPLKRWNELLGKPLKIRRVVKNGEEISAQKKIVRGTYFHQRYWGLKFKKPDEVDYVPSLSEQILLSDRFGSCLVITARPFGPKCLTFDWFELFVQKLLNSYPNKKIQAKATDQIAPNRKMMELLFKVEEEEPLIIRVLITSRGEKEGLLFVLICKEKNYEKTKKWFLPWLTSVRFE